MIETILKGLAIAPKGKSELIDRAKEKYSRRNSKFRNTNNTICLN